MKKNVFAFVSSFILAYMVLMVICMKYFADYPVDEVVEDAGGTGVYDSGLGPWNEVQVWNGSEWVVADSSVWEGY